MREERAIWRCNLCGLAAIEKCAVTTEIGFFLQIAFYFNGRPAELLFWRILQTFMAAALVQDSFCFPSGPQSLRPNRKPKITTNYSDFAVQIRTASR